MVRENGRQDCGVPAASQFAITTPVIILYTMTDRPILDSTNLVRSVLGLAGLLLAACGGREAAGSWTLRADTARAGAGAGTQVTASLRTDGTEGPDGQAPTHAVVLSFDCFGDNATVAIMTDQALRQGSTDVRLTVDSARPRALKGFAGTTSTGGKVLLTISQDSLLALLNGHHRAIVSYADGAGSYKTTAKFPIEGLERHQTAFLAACPKTAKKGTPP